MQQITGPPARRVTSQHPHGRLLIRVQQPVAQAVMRHIVHLQNLQTMQRITGLPVRHAISQKPHGLLRIRLQQQVVQVVMFHTVLL